jgi:hypothetical protein
MATAEQYEAALSKAERQGYSGLSSIEKQLVDRLTKEVGARGNRARQAAK